MAFLLLCSHWLSENRKGSDEKKLFFSHYHFASIIKETHWTFYYILLTSILELSNINKTFFPI